MEDKKESGGVIIENRNSRPLYAKAEIIETNKP